MPEGVTLSRDELYNAALKIQSVSHELLQRVMVARHQEAAPALNDVRLIVSLWRECKRAEMWPS